MEDISVSVVMPVYNGKEYIDAAIQSVLRQSVDWELIVVDDASTDGTDAVVASYRKDKRITYIRNPHNLGVAKSRTKGVELAKAKYVAFLDADDYWTEDKLERQVRLMEEKNAVLSSTGRELMDEGGTLTGKIVGIPETISYRTLLKGNCLNTSGVMVLTAVAKNYPMTQEHLHEDYITWLQIVKDYKVAYGLNAPLVKYRVMQGTKSGNKLKSARMTFGVYRYIGLNVFQACYYFCWYAVKGLLKYI